MDEIILFAAVVIIVAGSMALLVIEARDRREAKKRRSILDAQWKRFFEYVEDVEPDKVPEYRLKAMRWGQG